MAGAPPAYYKDPSPVGDQFGPFFSVELISVAEEQMHAAAAQEVGAAVAGAAAAATGGVAFGTTTGGLSSDGAVNNIETTNLSEMKELAKRIPASLTAESRAGHPYKITLTLTPEYEDGRELLDSRFITYAMLGKAKGGYITSDGRQNITGPHSFRVLETVAKFEQDISITLMGYDVVYDVGLRNTTGEVWKRSIATYKTDFGIIKELVERNQDYTMDPTAEADLGKINTTILDDQDEDLEQHITDWALISQLLRKHGLTFVIKDDVVRIYDPSNPPEALVSPYVFKWRTPPTGEMDILVNRFHGNYLPSMFLPPEGHGLLSLVYDPETGKVEGKKVDASDVDSVQFKDKDVAITEKDRTNAARIHSGWKGLDEEGNPIVIQPPPKDKDIGKKASVPPGPKSGDVDGRIKNIIKEAEFFSHPIVKLNCQGVPDIFPGLIVKLVGATKAFDGRYSVLGVKHIVSDSGYDMDVELIRNYGSDAPIGNPELPTKRVSDGQTDKPPTAADNVGRTRRNRRIG
jgi:hypothetical protein